MAELSHIDAKKIVFDAVSFGDGFNMDGSRCLLTNIPKRMFGIRLSILNKLSACAEIGYIEKELLKDATNLQVTPEMLTWYKISDIKNPDIDLPVKAKDANDKYLALEQRFLDDKIEFNHDEVAVFRYFYARREAFEDVVRTDELCNVLLTTFGIKDFLKILGAPPVKENPLRAVPDVKPESESAGA